MSKSESGMSRILVLQKMFRYHFSEVAYTDVTTDARVLFDAVRHGKTHLVRFILEASAIDVVNARDLHGKTPLITCCYTKVSDTYIFICCKAGPESKPLSRPQGYKTNLA